METRTTASPLGILATAIVLGALGDWLLRAGPLGLNVFLWVAALALAIVALAVRNRIPLRGDGRWLLLPALIFAGAVAWRSSPTLQALNVAAVLLTLALAAFRLRDGRIRVGHVSEYAWGLMVTAAAVGAGTVTLLSPALRDERTRLASHSTLASVAGRGLLVTVPLVAVFGALFVAADAVFARFASSLVAVDPVELLGHVFWASTWGWVAASVLFQCLTESAPPPQLRPASALRLGPIEVGTILGALDLLFLAFVVIQVRYLFGGASEVEASTDLTYAEYARRGFFELLAVAALVLPVILGIHWLLRDSSRPLKLAFRLLATGLVVLVFVVIVSAVRRMEAYVDQFGLTALRLYSTAFIAWLALVFAWLLLTVIRGRRERFAFGAAMSGFLVLAVLNMLNPDAFIARTNLHRAEHGRDFDVAHASTLSADATPTLIAGLASLPAEGQCQLGNALQSDAPKADSWRHWNYGRAEARAAIEANESVLAAACGP